MSNKYSIGTKVTFDDIIGEIIDNFKFPGDICIEWETGLISSYDEDWLNNNVTILTKKKKHNDNTIKTRR